MHYTTPKGMHRAKDFQSMEELNKVRSKFNVWAVTEWETINGIHKGTAIEWNRANY